jgi:hypothetical protein
MNNAALKQAGSLKKKRPLQQALSIKVTAA